MIDLLPDAILQEIFGILKNKDQRKCMQLSKGFYKLLAPIVGTVFSYKDEAQGKDVAYLSKHLENHGKFVKTLNTLGIKSIIVPILGRFCPNVELLVSVFAYKGSVEEEAKLVVELSKSLPSLGGALFIGSISLSFMDLVQPIVERVSKLSVVLMDLAWTPEGAIYNGLGSDSVKKFHLHNSRFFEDSFPSFISKFKNVEYVSLSHTRIPEYDFRAISYQVKDSTIYRAILGHSEKLFTREAETFACNKISDNPEQDFISGSLALTELYSVVSTDRFQSIFSNELQNPPIIFSSLGSKKDSLEKFWQSYSGSEVIGMKIMDKKIDHIRIPSEIFSAKSVSFSVSDGLPATYFKWLATCFPNLEDLHLANNSALTIQEYRAGELQFNNLKRIFSYEDHTLGFWKKMVASSPNLFQINLLPESNLRPRLQALFPDILFGHYRRASELEISLALNINPFFE